MRFKSGFTAVITGGASGLGRALCLEAARRGGRIIVADIAEEGAEDTAQLLRSRGTQAWALGCDVSQWEEVEALERRARELVGEVDLVANNAGVAGGGNIGEIPLEDWHWLLGVNLWGVIHGCRAFVPAMRKRNCGAILNVSSGAAFASLAKMAPYNVSKAGVNALTETLAAELEGTSVTVTALCPSFFPTNVEKTARGDDPLFRAQVRHMMRMSWYNADDMARFALDSVEAGRLHAVPMPDAWLAWLVKRIAPGSFHRLTNFVRSKLDVTLDSELGPPRSAKNGSSKQQGAQFHASLAHGDHHG